MNEILNQLAVCIERGKVNLQSPFPPDLKGQEGADELTRKALDSDISPESILNNALMIGMKRVGDKFEAGTAFIPDMLIAAKAMNVAMEHLRPFFESGAVKLKGTFVIGTVTGDLHDIGKNIVRMVLTGSGWNVIDLGVDVPTEKFLKAIEDNPGCMVGMSALLTTTMTKMGVINEAIKSRFPDTKVFVGGAPLSQSFNDEIGADGYFPDPNKFTKYLDTLI
ncbi:corrinoid protein [candidate division KSB1 bacterium]|nr:corrinoid protein [candidate division KSB1 bacterium]